METFLKNTHRCRILGGLEIPGNPGKMCSIFFTLENLVDSNLSDCHQILRGVQVWSENAISGEKPTLPLYWPSGMGVYFTPVGFFRASKTWNPLFLSIKWAKTWKIISEYILVISKIIKHNETNHSERFDRDENTFHKIDILLILLIKTMYFKFLML